MTEFSYAVVALAAYLAGMVVGYRLKSSRAHLVARRQRLERQHRRTAEQLADLPPRMSTADISHRSDRDNRTSG